MMRIFGAASEFFWSEVAPTVAIPCPGESSQLSDHADIDEISLAIEARENRLVSLGRAFAEIPQIEAEWLTPSTDVPLGRVKGGFVLTAIHTAGGSLMIGQSLR